MHSLQGACRTFQIDGMSPLGACSVFFQTNDTMKCPQDSCFAQLRARDIAEVIYKYRKEFSKERFHHLKHLMYVRVFEVMAESDLSEGYLTD